MSRRNAVRRRLPAAIALTVAALALGACGAEPVPVSPPAQAPARASVPAPAPAPGATGAFPESWFFTDNRTGRRYAAPQTLEGSPAPPLQVQSGSWIGEARDLDQLVGSVVVLDFWATWCRPCLAALPKNVMLADEYRDRGVVFVGIHDARSGWQTMGAIAQQMKINYSLAIDDRSQSAARYLVGFWPTYVAIDHRGVVRAAGLVPERVEDVVKALVEEREKDAQR